jgi:periplasmic protein TonB
MFEVSLVESQPTPISPTRQWTTIASVAIQSVAAALLVLTPLLHPERLALHLEPPHLLLPVPPKPPVHIQAQTTAQSSSNAIEAPSQTESQTTSLISILNHQGTPASDAPPLTIGSGDSMTGSALPNILTNAATGPAVSMAPTRPAKLLAVSTGVAAGLLLTPIRPPYPPIARAAHVEGTVVVEAIIARTGTIESLHVVSGPEMLRQASLDAIHTARYEPYLLNGEPTEVQTTITVNFRLGS